MSEYLDQELIKAVREDNKKAVDSIGVGADPNIKLDVKERRK